MPLTSLGESHLGHLHKWQEVADPYTGEHYLAIPAIQLDWAIIHVQQADLLGNARIFGSKFEDVLLARSARHVLITCEELLPAYAFADQPENTDIPGLLVDCVVYVPHGAYPTSCYQHYSLVEKEIEKVVSFTETESFLAWFDSLQYPCAPSPLLGSALVQGYLLKGEGGAENA